MNKKDIINAAQAKIDEEKTEKVTVQVEEFLRELENLKKMTARVQKQMEKFLEDSDVVV